jgi:hypothetical protein
MKPAADTPHSAIRSSPKNHPTRSSLRILPLALVLLSALRCNEAPTQPATAIRTPTPAPLDLNGEWSGTFEGGLCATPEEIRVRLGHVEDRFGGGFTSSCIWGTGRVVVMMRGTVGGYITLSVNDMTACQFDVVAVTSTSIRAWKRASSSRCKRLRLSR